MSYEPITCNQGTLCNNTFFVAAKQLKTHLQILYAYFPLKDSVPILMDWHLLPDICYICFFENITQLMVEQFLNIVIKIKDDFISCKLK